MTPEALEIYTAKESALKRADKALRKKGLYSMGGGIGNTVSRLYGTNNYHINSASDARNFVCEIYEIFQQSFTQSNIPITPGDGNDFGIAFFSNGPRPYISMINLSGNRLSISEDTIDENNKILLEEPFVKTYSDYLENKMK
jgi:hypothetical protein